MKIIQEGELESEFSKIVKEHAEKTPLTAQAALDLFADFFFNTDIEGFSKDSQRDMALFQYGPHDFEHPELQLNFTRQLTYMDENGEYSEMKHLSFSIYYTNILKGEDFWFDVWFSTSKQEWMDQVTNSEGFMLTKDRPSDKYELYFDEV